MDEYLAPIMRVADAQAAAAVGALEIDDNDWLRVGALEP